MRYTVKVLRRAEREVEDILHFIRQERKSPAGARSWYHAYEAALKELAESAAALPLAPENDFVVGNEVRLLHVRGPGQDVMNADKVAITLLRDKPSKQPSDTTCLSPVVGRDVHDGNVVDYKFRTPTCKAHHAER